MKGILKDVVRYFLWMVNSFASFYLLILARGFIVTAMVQSGAAQPIVNLVDRVALMILGIAALVYIIFAEWVYRKRGWPTFFRHSAFQVLLYTGIVYGELLVVHLTVPVLRWMDLVWLLLQVGIAGALLYVHRQCNRRPQLR